MYFCYLTIDNIPILKNELLNYILLEFISLYVILRVITYFEVPKFYDKDDNPLIGVIVYFIIYIINLGIMYAIMLLLTKVGILPI